MTIATQYAPIIDLLQENSNTFRPALPTIARVSFDHKTRWEDLFFKAVQSAMCYVLCAVCYVHALGGACFQLDVWKRGFCKYALHCSKSLCHAMSDNNGFAHIY